MIVESTRRGPKRSPSHPPGTWNSAYDQIKALKIIPMVTLLNPYSLLMSVAVFARLTRSRYVMRYIRQRRSSTTQRTWLRPDASDFSIPFLHHTADNLGLLFRFVRSRSDIHRAIACSNLFSERGRILFDFHLPCKFWRVRISCCINPNYEHSANFGSVASQFPRQARGFFRAGRRTRK